MARPTPKKRPDHEYSGFEIYLLCFEDLLIYGLIPKEFFNYTL